MLEQPFGFAAEEVALVAETEVVSGVATVVALLQVQMAAASVPVAADAKIADAAAAVALGHTAVDVAVVVAVDMLDAVVVVLAVSWEVKMAWKPVEQLAVAVAATVAVEALVVERYPMAPCMN